MTSSIELISFNICPFVQRSVITLLEKQVPFDTTYIDLANKPDWFKKISPLGKVPVVKIDGEHVLFESAVINEYLDEITPPSLIPQDPLEKAKQRAWIEYASAIIMAQYTWCIAKKDKFESAQAAYFEKLSFLENAIPDSTYAAGNDFSLLDCALAPALMRHERIDEYRSESTLEKWPKLQALQHQYNLKDSVKNSVLPEFSQLYKDYMTKAESALLK